jgi:HSP20 family protein
MPQGPWDSYKTLMEIRRRMRQLFEEGIQYSQMVQDLEEDGNSWTPPFDVIETTDSILIYGELPGINKDEISVQLKGTELVVRGERHPEVGESVTYHLAERYYGVFQRTFHLSGEIDDAGIETQLNGGMLCIRVPKHKPRTIPIQ